MMLRFENVCSVVSNSEAGSSRKNKCRRTEKRTGISCLFANIPGYLEHFLFKNLLVLGKKSAKKLPLTGLRGTERI